METPDAKSLKSGKFTRRFLCRHSKVDVEDENLLPQALHLKR